MPDSERPGSGDSGTGKFVILNERDASDAARLFRLFADPAIHESAFPNIFPQRREGQGEEPDRQALINRAQLLLDSRRARKRYLPPDLFGEPAWDVLLALYVTEQSATRLPIGKLAELVEAPLSTIVRWVRALEAESLVGRVDHPTDRRIVFIRLLDKGRMALDAYLAALPSPACSKSDQPQHSP
jgi:DNA-binding MarR family transcriptional regulator